MLGYENLRKVHEQSDSDSDDEPEIVQKVDIDVSNLTPLSPEVISKQSECRSISLMGLARARWRWLYKGVRAALAEAGVQCADGGSAKTSTGGGGQSCGYTGAVRRKAVAVAAAVCGGSAGGGGQEKRSGTSGVVVQRTRGVQEAMRVRGTRGKLIHACRDQRVGCSVSRTSKRSGAMNPRTAKAP